jgi:predicted amino acid racemase
MATIKVFTSRIIENIKKINSYLAANDMEWTLITKMLNGNRTILEKIIQDENVKNVHSMGDSRMSNLKVIKDINPEIVTMYIKPPPHALVKNVIKYADISFNTSLSTIERLNTEAKKNDKIHRVIVMIEMGELREGILREKVLKFYDSVFNLSNINMIGFGTNLGCMYGIEPTYDKLIQLSLLKQLIEAKFGHKLQLVSAGSSITLPLIKKKKIPMGINHFRIGEAAFLGTSPLDNKKFRDLSENAFEFNAEILEVEKKSNVPDGQLGEGNVGHTAATDFDEIEYSESYRAIVDFGTMDVDVNNLKPKYKNGVSFFGTTSDMTVYDLGSSKSGFKVGEQIKFSPNYMAVARLLNSKYITKLVK